MWQLEQDLILEPDKIGSKNNNRPSFSFRRGLGMGLLITPDDIANLTIAERMELVQLIWDSIEECAPPFELSEEWKREIERRSAEHDANPGDAIPWEVVKAEALARYDMATDYLAKLMKRLKEAHGE